MKSIAAAALLALTLCSGAVRADDGKSEEPTTIVIHAATMEEAMKQIESMGRNVGSTVIILLTNPDGTTTEHAQRDVGSIGVSI